MTYSNVPMLMIAPTLMLMLTPMPMANVEADAVAAACLVLAAR